MTRIMIMDDNDSDIKVLSNLIYDFFEVNKVEYNLTIHHNLDFDEFEFDDVDILFLDMKINRENGLKFATEIRKQYKDLIIIITSNYPQFLVDGYTISAKRYFIKPIDSRIFNSEMKIVLDELFRREKGFYEYTISSDMIYCKNIFYIEYYDRMSIIHLTNGSNIKSHQTLKYWLDLLQDFDFCQPYRSYLVNLQYVDGFSKDGKDIFISNGEKIPVSKLYKKIFKEKYYKYILGSL